jgi:flagellin FlaB
VLINTAGFLQSQAETTGQESTDQVSNGLEVASATASTDSSSEITGAAVDLTVQLAPGSDPIAFSNLTVEAFGDRSLNTVQDGSGNDIGTSATSVVLEEGSFETISLSFGSGTTGDLKAGDQIDVAITTASGSQTTETLLVPDPLDPDETVRL